MGQTLTEDVKSVAKNIMVSYYVLFATQTGMERLRRETLFDSVECIFELDETFKCFHARSRFFEDTDATIRMDFCQQLCESYGDRLCPGFPLGYGDCQLLVGFFHNTPDNTLPIIWYDDPDVMPWTPIFKRYPKQYG